MAVTVICFTDHVREQMRARGISAEIVVGVIENPQQRVAASKGRSAYQSRYFDPVEQTDMLMRAIVEPRGADLVVVSVYKTSRIAKYWLEA